MKNRRLTIVTSLAFALLAGLWASHDAAAEAPPPFKRTELRRQDLSTPGREAVMARAEIQPGADVPKHSHPGEEISYVLEGELTLEIEGKPPLKAKAGDSFIIPAGAVHGGKATGKGVTQILSTYIVEKGKPLATPKP